MVELLIQMSKSPQIVEVRKYPYAISALGYTCVRLPPELNLLYESRDTHSRRYEAWIPK